MNEAITINAVYDDGQPVRLTATCTDRTRRRAGAAWARTYTFQASGRTFSLEMVSPQWQYGVGRTYEFVIEFPEG